MTKKAKNIMMEKMKKRRSDSKLEKEKLRRNKLAKKHKNNSLNLSKDINLKGVDSNELKEEYNKVQKAISVRPGKDIKNKEKRKELILQRTHRKKMIKSRLRRNNQERKEKLSKEDLEIENEKEKNQIKTIDNQREFDDTYIDNDEDLEEEIKNDEFTPYFNKEYDPQILITTSIVYTSTIFKFIKALKETIPNSYFYYRKKQDIGQMIEFAKEKNFSTLMVVTEECKKPYRITIAHLLGKGLTAEFKISDVLYREDIKGAGSSSGVSDYNPELIFKNFKTKLGFRVQRIFNSMFPIEEEVKGRRVVTFHNQRDYIFFRHHRYQFEKELDGVRLQEIGPSFTMRLLSVQEGLFEREKGDFEFNYKDRMGIRRRKFYL